MPSKTARLLLLDIVEASAAIVPFCQEFEVVEALRDDDRTRSAVERKLLIVSKAAIRHGDAADALCPGQDWRGIRGLGNHIRHAYDGLNYDLLWKLVREDVPRLIASPTEAIRTLEHRAEEEHSC